VAAATANRGRHDTRPFWVTRRILAAWPRFRDAATDREEAAIVLWCHLDRMEVIALERLRDQWQEAGPIAEWFQNMDLRGGVVPALMEGFLWDAEAEAAIVRGFGPGTVGQVTELAAALARLREERAMEQHERVEVLRQEGTVAERLMSLARERGIDIARTMSRLEKERLASELGCTAGTLGQGITRLRRQMRAQMETNGHAANGNGKAPRPGGVDSSQLTVDSPTTARPVPSQLSTVNRQLSTPPAILGPAEAIAEVVLAYGTHCISPPELREPVAALVRAALARGSR
jgi:hypothetical protein